MGKRLKICDFILPELEKIEKLANFTVDELKFFNLRAKGKSIVQICHAMHISESKATSLSKAVSKKIMRIL